MSKSINSKRTKYIDLPRVDVSPRGLVMINTYIVHIQDIAPHSP